MKTTNQIIKQIVRDESGIIDLRATASAINPYFTEKYGVATSQWPENDETRAWHHVWHEVIYPEFPTDEDDES